MEHAPGFCSGLSRLISTYFSKRASEKWSRSDENEATNGDDDDDEKKEEMMKNEDDNYYHYYYHQQNKNDADL